MVVKITEQNQLERAAQNSAMAISPLFLPDTQPLYAARAARFDELAPGHALGTYLQFCAVLCRAQDAAARHLTFTLPEFEPEHWAKCAESGMPPLDVMTQISTCLQSPVWPEVLQHIVQTMKTEPGLSPEVKQTLQRLVTLDADVLTSAAETLLTDFWDDLDRAQLPFIGAAVQVMFNRFAVQIKWDRLGTKQRFKQLCPICGSPPIASRIRPGAGGLRYLHCSVCETEWHFVRATCTQCDSAEDIAYWSVEGQDSPMRAESCGSCHHYTKALNPEKVLVADVLADDLATLSLDIALDEKGFSRVGPNRLFAPGEI